MNLVVEPFLASIAAGVIGIALQRYECARFFVALALFVSIVCGLFGMLVVAAGGPL